MKVKELIKELQKFDEEADLEFVAYINQEYDEDSLQVFTIEKPEVEEACEDRCMMTFVF